MKITEKIPSLLKNRYFLTSVFFVVWLTFFDHYNFFFHADLADQKEELQIELNRLKGETTKNKIFLRNTNNAAFMEKYAREQYLMKKDGEDIFMVD